MIDPAQLAIVQARAELAAARARVDVLEHELGAESGPCDDVAPPTLPLRKPTPKKRAQAVVPPSPEEMSTVTPLDAKRALEVGRRIGMVDS